MNRVVFTKQQNTVNVEDCDPNNIYIFCTNMGKYKLHRDSTGKWAWTRFNSSFGHWNGTKNRFEDALNSVSEREVWEFASLKDYAKWLYEEEVPK